MSSDSKNCVGFSVIELEPHKHVIKLGRSGWFRRICCLRGNCGVTEGSIRQNIFRFRKNYRETVQKTSNKPIDKTVFDVCPERCCSMQKLGEFVH